MSQPAWRIPWLPFHHDFWEDMINQLFSELWGVELSFLALFLSEPSVRQPEEGLLWLELLRGFEPTHQNASWSWTLVGLRISTRAAKELGTSCKHSSCSSSPRAPLMLQIKGGLPVMWPQRPLASLSQHSSLSFTKGLATYLLSILPDRLGRHVTPWVETVSPVPGRTQGTCYISIHMWCMNKWIIWKPPIIDSAHRTARRGWAKARLGCTGLSGFQTLIKSKKMEMNSKYGNTWYVTGNRVQVQ